MNKTKLVPFDIEKAKNGAKVVTRCGFPARIVLYDLEDDRLPIIAAVRKDGKEIPGQYTIDGNFYPNKEEDVLDLFIEEEVKTRQMTNQELSDWLCQCPEECREFKYKTCSTVLKVHTYYEDKANEPAESILIRRNHGEWEEPLVEV